MNTTEDFIASAGISLLLKEPFFAHLLSSIPRMVSDRVELAGLEWNGQAPQLLFHPDFARKAGSPGQRAACVKHLLLHLVFKHLLRKADLDPNLHNIAADLVVSQWIQPWPQIPKAITLESFPELDLQADETLDYYYAKLASLLRIMKRHGLKLKKIDAVGGDTKKSPRKGVSETTPEWAKKSKMPQSALALAKLCQVSSSGDLMQTNAPAENSSHWAAAEFSLETIAVRTLDRTSPKDRGTIPEGLQRLLEEYASKRKPAVDWKHALRLFTGSSYRTKLSHTLKRISKRYGSRPGIRIKKLHRICMAIDTSGSVSDRELSLVFHEIRHVWRAGAEVMVVECDAAIHQSYRYNGKTPNTVKGGGGTDFNPVFQWMQSQPKFDAMIYLTDGLAPAPDIKPNCPLLWLILPGNNQVDFPIGKCVLMP